MSEVFGGPLGVNWVLPEALLKPSWGQLVASWGVPGAVLNLNGKNDRPSLFKTPKFGKLK